MEKIDLEEGEEVIVRIEKVKSRDMRRAIVERFYGVLGPAPKELLDEFMAEAETWITITVTHGWGTGWFTVSIHLVVDGSTVDETHAMYYATTTTGSSFEPMIVDVNPRYKDTDPGLYDYWFVYTVTLTNRGDADGWVRLVANVYEGGSELFQAINTLIHLSPGELREMIVEVPHDFAQHGAGLFTVSFTLHAWATTYDYDYAFYSISDSSVLGSEVSTITVMSPTVYYESMTIYTTAWLENSNLVVYLRYTFYTTIYWGIYLYRAKLLLMSTLTTAYNGYHYVWTTLITTVTLSIDTDIFESVTFGAIFWKSWRYDDTDSGTWYYWRTKLEDTVWNTYVDTSLYNPGGVVLANAPWDGLVLDGQCNSNEGTMVLALAIAVQYESGTKTTSITFWVKKWVFSTTWYP